MIPAAWVLYAWLPCVVVLFATLPPRRAVLWGFLLAWLFLPVHAIGMSGLPDYTKTTATTFGVALGVLLFDSGRLSRFRPRLCDLPMLVWCLCPFASSISNGNGAYDGVSAVVYQSVTWGGPYFIGRLYFDDLRGLRELALGIFAGGLIYVPLCLLEIRLSPQLHLRAYGYHQHEFAQTMRGGGFRPMVFMEHGLHVGLWMAAATLVGYALWSSGSLRRFAKLPTGWWVLALLATSILCKSTGATVLLALGLALLWICRRSGSAWPVGLVLLAALSYCGTRALELWDGKELVQMAELVSEDRAASLQFRLTQEDRLALRALERPLLGWTPWSFNVVQLDWDEWGMVVSDGQWIIAFGTKGLVGLAALAALLCAPVVSFARRFPARRWGHPLVAPGAALAVFLALYFVDSLFNAMINPVVLLAIGGLAHTRGLPPRPPSRPWRKPLQPAQVRPSSALQHAAEQ